MKIRYGISPANTDNFESLTDEQAEDISQAIDPNDFTAQQIQDLCARITAECGLAGTAATTSYDNTGSGLTAADVQAAIDELVVNLTGIVHTAITNIDLAPTGNPNEYTVQIEWTDSNGVAQTTTDPTPITVNGGLMVQRALTVIAPNSVNPLPETPLSEVQFKVNGLDARIGGITNAGTAVTVSPAALGFNVGLTDEVVAWYQI